MRTVFLVCNLSCIKIKKYAINALKIGTPEVWKVPGLYLQERLKRPYLCVITLYTGIGFFCLRRLFAQDTVCQSRAVLRYRSLQMINYVFSAGGQNFGSYAWSFASKRAIYCSNIRLYPLPHSAGSHTLAYLGHLRDFPVFRIVPKLQNT